MTLGARWDSAGPDEASPTVFHREALPVGQTMTISMLLVMIAI